MSNRETGPRNTTGAAFRRSAATVAVACAVAGSLVGLGSVGALAAPERTSAHASIPTAQPTPVPKVQYGDADIARFRASPYADDAVALAAVWGTDLATAKGRAGADLRTGTALPFAAGDAASYPFTPEQQRDAFFLGYGDFRQALGLAVQWGVPDVYAVKSKLGSKMLAHLPVPLAPTTYTEAEEARAFTASGYDEGDAARLAALWQSPSTYSAEVRAGQALLAGDALPV
ncbi:hypothetical protein GA0004736_3616 [Curtobacterium sp. 9128]|uniref:hypothetical protein n=1 Tax=Curtobacterium sp. 9128 TaxID=1793722 RepID=UPI0007D7176F|nr:hypothetical protein [Curtobacterium sp. 9128]SBN64653.1 hypothetical protein GA0004736_3616 [Curtobacterium sp. 9128]